MGSPYSEKQKAKIRKQLKRRRKIRRFFRGVTVIAFLCVCVWVFSLLLGYIINSVTEMPLSDSDVETVEKEETEEPNEAEGDKSEGDDIGTFDLSSLIDPVTLNPNEAIDLYYMADEVLPKVYTSTKFIYKTFATDNPVLGSNTTTKVIVIDAGHQTETRKSDVWLSPYLDPSSSSSWVYSSLLKIGTEGTVTKIPEYTTVHEISLLLKKALEKLGYTVILSHPDVDEQLSGPERAAVANQNNADLMISIHCNSYEKDKTQSGALALVPECYSGYPSKRLEYLSEAAATVILDEYTTATGFKNRGLDPIIKSSMFAFCKVPIVLLELGYSSCPSDDKKMNDDEFREKMVDGIVNGINKYFSLIELGTAK